MFKGELCRKSSAWKTDSGNPLAALPVLRLCLQAECSCDQVLDEEDLIQECKALNGRLIAFLKQPAVLAALLGYLVDAPPPSALS